MSTITASKKRRAAGKTKIAAAKKDSDILHIKGVQKNVATKLVDINPKNYRLEYDLKGLEDFANEISVHGIINPLTVRPKDGGRYEVVAGERRLRAARIARLQEIPVVIKDVDDEQALELMISENLQREDTHPMYQAVAVGQMMAAKKTTDEIAARLGKSKAFVFSRQKLLSLIEPLRNVFVANKMNLREALEIAMIDSSSQEKFYQEYCKGWENKERLNFYNLSNMLRQFRYNLKQAPFDTKDKNLLPDVGACTNCVFNSATVKILFADLAKESICSNKACYQRKCVAQFAASIDHALKNHKPTAIIYRENISADNETVIASNDVLKKLEKYEYSTITVISEPEKPEEEDHTGFYDSDEEETFDEAGFKEAVEEYETDLETYKNAIADGKYLPAIFIGENDLREVYFSHEKPKEGNGEKKKSSAKELAVAMKAGKATIEMFEAEVDRLKAKKERSKELDRVKVQLKIYEGFTKFVKEPVNSIALTEADIAATRLVLFQSLGYDTKREVSTALFGKGDVSYKKLVAMTEAQHSYLVRMAIVSRSDSKIPTFINGEVLYNMAAGAGFDVAAIEKVQEGIATERELGVDSKITVYQKRIKRKKSAQ